MHCDLYKVGGEFNPRPNSLAFRKDFPNMNMMGRIDEMIVEMREDGSIQKLKDKWWYEMIPEKVCDEHRKMTNGITLRNAGGVFMVIAGGIIVTILALWIENWYYYHKTIWDARKARQAAIQQAPKVKSARRCAIL
jgi:hypothetical protein